MNMISSTKHESFSKDKKDVVKFKKRKRSRYAENQEQNKIKVFKHFYCTESRSFNKIPEFHI